MLEEKLEIDRLYDTYRSLLTEKQVQVLDQHLYLDYSLVEVADNLGISRQAVHDTVKKAVQMMEDIESKIGCMKLAQAHENLLSAVRLYAERIPDCGLMEIVEQNDI